MRIYSHFNTSFSQRCPAALTIGNFDGVHLGHQAVIKKTVETAKLIKGQSVVITFSNHPKEILSPQKDLELLCTPEHKEKLLAKMGVDVVFFLTFTKEFSKQNPDFFLNTVKQTIDYREMILGYDAKIGSKGKGDRRLLLELSSKYGFGLTYIDPYLINKVPVSSSLIREAVKCGDLLKAKLFLGRPFSIFSRVMKQTHEGAFSKIIIFCEKLCLPKKGTYEVLVQYSEQKLKGVGFCEPQKLSVLLFSDIPHLVDQKVDILFSSLSE